MSASQIRRQLLQMLAASAAGIPGVRSIAGTASAGPTVLSGTQKGPPGNGVTIDVHTHVFNGTDLQLARFLEDIVAKDLKSELQGIVKVFGDILQFINWNSAPSAVEEGEKIQIFERAARTESFADGFAAVASARQDGYSRGRKALQEAANKTKPLGPVPDDDQINSFRQAARQGDLRNAIRLLPKDVTSFRDEKANVQTISKLPNVIGYIDFALHFFNYRHVNVVDYFDTYSKDTRRSVDLVVPHMVDYDWWLAQGQPTAQGSTLRKQVELMKRISVAMGGRVHAFVPFCPFRELMTVKDKVPGESLSLVQDAILKHGFVGVKLYPPMGFAPYGNAALSVWKDQHNLPAAAKKADFGEKLDAAMASLFEFCLKNDVPIMAHTSHSNGPNDAFEELASAKYWEQALIKKEFRGLRVDFGHSGDTDPVHNMGKLSEEFFKLMTADAGSSGQRAFGDTGYFEEVLTAQGPLGKTLDTLLSQHGGLLFERLMYGTDWEMTLPLRKVDNYLSNFLNIIQVLEKKYPGKKVRNMSFSDAFFGGNATAFLGLDSAGNSNARVRLQEFYSREHVKTPDWFAHL